jgi:peroxiredoxin
VPKFKLLLSFLFIINSCLAFGQKTQIQVSASLTGFKDSTKFYLINLDSTQQKDSTYLINGKLKFNCTISEPQVFRLKTYFENDFFSTNFWIEQKSITISGSKEYFSDLKIIGSPLNDIFKSVLEKVAALESLRNKLIDLTFAKSNEKIFPGIVKSISLLDKEVLKIRVETIANFTPSLITLNELYFLRNDLTKDSLRLLFDKFPSSLKKTKYGEVISQYLISSAIKLGSSAPDITGQDFNKKETKLSSLRNKVVLLDFWASWCAPCRESIKDLAELYKRYQSSGFEIFSFSLDNDFNEWKTASLQDNINWINVSDLKAFYSKQPAAYKIRSIPQTFLIDREGKIIGIYSGFSKDGTAKLERDIQKSIQ